MVTVLNLLAERPTTSSDNFPITWLGIGEGFLYALLGFVVTFLGVAILIGIVYLFGFIVKKTGSASAKKMPAKAVAGEAPSEEISEEIRVAIVAAIAAYYQSENSACEFKVRRIKRL